MKRLLSAVLAVILILSVASSFAFVSGAEDSTTPGYMKYIKDIEETEIIIDGLTKTYRFLQIADSHVVNISSNTSSYYYSESVARYNQFATLDPTSNGYPAKDTFNAMMEYAKDPANKIDSVWMTGDNIDFPSSENVSFINNHMSALAAAGVDHQYCFGNHDWTYPQKYFTTEGRNSFRPLLTSAMGGNNLITVRDYGQFIVCCIDNSENYVYYDGVMNGIKNYVANQGKPVILMCHVPMYNADLKNYCVGVWGTDETMNPNNSKYPVNAATRYVSEFANSSTCIAVFSGHLHINYEGKLPGGTPIYDTNGGYTGTMRLITVRPRTCPDDEHIWDDGNVVVEPTTKPGSKTYVCTVCQTEKTEVLPALAVAGDADGNGEVTTADLLALRKIFSKTSTCSTHEQFLACDVNFDGKLTAADSLILRKYVANVITTLD